MKWALTILILLLSFNQAHSWGFFGHKKINQHAIYLLPAELMVLFKPNADFLIEHSVDPDKRRYAVPEEGPRHYIDIDHYGAYPFDSLPRNWNAAVEKFSADTLQKYGIVPWWLQIMLSRLTEAFREKNMTKILKYAAELGHYLGDAHVPLHANRNHNGQYTGQHGIHGFWESRVPELLADVEWDFYIGKAEYIHNPSAFIWKIILESAAAADTVLRYEKELTRSFPADQKYSFEERNGILIRQYSAAFAKAYDTKLDGMIERRMRGSIFSVASFWYTAWINAGQPDLKQLVNRSFTPDELLEFEELDRSWKNAVIRGREHEQ
jgi:hypothetical protein